MRCTICDNPRYGKKAAETHVFFFLLGMESSATSVPKLVRTIARVLGAAQPFVAPIPAAMHQYARAREKLKFHRYADNLNRTVTYVTNGTEKGLAG
jgi:hypothetical protein